MYRNIPNNEKVVYFICSGNFLKIGIASQLKTRLKAIHTDCPDGANLYGYISGGEYYRELETELHQRFSAFHYRGEWFFKTEKLLKEISELDKFTPYSLEAKEFFKQDINDLFAEIADLVKLERGDLPCNSVPTNQT